MAIIGTGIMRMKTKQIWLSILAIVAGATGFLLYTHRFAEVDHGRFVSAGQGVSGKIYPRKEAGHLYFGSWENMYLKAEPRVFERPADAAEFGRLVLDRLLEGPQRDLVDTIPENTKLSAFFLDENGTAYADFSGEIARNHPGGAAAELLTIYSIVNSLTLNVEEIEKVKILIDGREAATLAGHVDLREPFQPDVMYIR
jgi:hypothetical protein